MKQTLRSIGRTPNFLFSATATLALGLAAAVVVFAIARALLLSPVDYRDPGRLVQLRERDGQGNFAPLTGAEIRLAQRRPELASVAAIDPGMFLLTGVPEPEEFAGAAITPNTLATLGIRPMLGHDLTAAQPDEVLLSYRAWTGRFGADPGIVGKVIDLDWSRTPARERYRVAGVLPARFWLFYRGLEVFIPLTDSILGSARPRQRYYVYARAAAAPGALPIDAQHALVASPLLQDLTENSRPAVLLLSAAACLLLLLACANVASLFLARGLRRQSEFAVRVALGASRWHLARLVLAEALAVCLGAAIAAAPLARAGLAILARYLPVDAGWMQFTPGLDRLDIDAWALAFAAAAALVCALLASALPIAHSSAVAGRMRERGSRQPYRHALVGVEVALATVLLCGAGLLMKSVARLDRADLGFLRGSILVLRTPRIGERASPAYYDELRRRIEPLPGVEAVTFTSYQPMTNTRPERRFSVEGGPEAAGSYCVVAPDFFRVYGVRILAGRGFTESDAAGAPPVVVINETAARTAFPGQSPLGGRIRLFGDAAPSEIVGVVSDIRQSLRGPAAPTVYRVSAQDPGAALQMGIRTYGDPLAVAAAVRREVGQAGGAAAEIATLDRFILGDSWTTQVSGAMVIVFSTVALAMAAFGIFSVVSYTAGQRAHEIGIRIALGARSSDIGRMMVLGGMRPVAAGVLAGGVGGLALSRFLQVLLFEVQPADPAVYAAAVLVLTGGALGALVVPARRAIATNPADSLRQL